MSNNIKKERSRSPYHATKELNQNKQKVTVLDFSDSGEDDNISEKQLVAQRIASYGIKDKKDNFQPQTFSVNKFTIPKNQIKQTYYSKPNKIPFKSRSYHNEKLNISGVKNEDLKHSQTTVNKNLNGNYSKLYFPKEEKNPIQLMKFIDNDNNNNLSRINLPKDSIDKLKKFFYLIEKKEKEKGMDILKNHLKTQKPDEQTNEEINKNTIQKKQEKDQNNPNIIKPITLYDITNKPKENFGGDNENIDKEKEIYEKNEKLDQNSYDKSNFRIQKLDIEIIEKEPETTNQFTSGKNETNNKDNKKKISEPNKQNNNLEYEKKKDFKNFKENHSLNKDLNSEKEKGRINKFDYSIKRINDKDNNYLENDSKQIENDNQENYEEDEEIKDRNGEYKQEENEDDIDEGNKMSEIIKKKNDINEENEIKKKTPKNNEEVIPSNMVTNNLENENLYKQLSDIPLYKKEQNEDNNNNIYNNLNEGIYEEKGKIKGNIQEKKVNKGEDIIQNDKKVEMEKNINEGLNSLKNFIDKKNEEDKKNVLNNLKNDRNTKNILNENLTIEQIEGNCSNSEKMNDSSFERKNFEIKSKEKEIIKDIFNTGNNNEKKNPKQIENEKKINEGIIKIEEVINKNKKEENQKNLNEINNLSNSLIPTIKSKSSINENPNQLRTIPRNPSIPKINTLTPQRSPNRFPVDEPDSPIMSINPVRKKKIERFLYNSNQDPKLLLYKSFKKWKLQNIKPKNFIGKKDRKIRIRTRIYYDQPKPKEVYIKKRKNEIITSRSSTPDKKNDPTIQTSISPFQIYTNNETEKEKRRNSSKENLQYLNKDVDYENQGNHYNKERDIINWKNNEKINEKKKIENENNTNKIDEEIMIGGGKIIELNIEENEEKPNDIKYNYYVRKGIEERPRNIIFSEENLNEENEDLEFKNKKKNLFNEEKDDDVIKRNLSEDIEYEQEEVKKIIPNIKSELITDIPDDKREVYIENHENNTNKIDEEIMIGGGEIIELNIEEKDEKPKDIKYKYYVKKTIEETSKSSFPRKPKLFRQLEERPRHIILNFENDEEKSNPIPIEELFSYNSLNNNILFDEDKNYENVASEENYHNIPLINENKIMKDLDDFIEDDKTEKTIEQQPIEIFESQNDDDPCCCKHLRVWLFIKICVYISYQKKSRVLRKRFEHWRKYCKI